MIVVTDHSGQLLLARHGATQDNTQGLILGHRDPPLSEAGREQAQILGRRALEAGVRAIWTSPLLRARQTATLVGVTLGIEPRVQRQLIESYRGSWEGRPVREIAAQCPELHAGFEAAAPDFRFPGGESLAEQVRRTREALNLIAGQPGPVIVVAHAGTIRAALIATGQRPPPEREIRHGELIEVAWDAARSTNFLATLLSKSL
jgi:broad specificity phosphatase PhoE